MPGDDHHSHIDTDNLRITGKHKAVDPHVDVKDDVTIVVTQAYGPRGDNLVGISDVTFDGYPAVTLLVKAGDREGLVHLSPIHGDDRKEGFTDIEVGTECEIVCPVSKQPLPDAGEIEGATCAHYKVLYLTPKLDKGSQVLVSNVWGHYHSRIVDDFELISHWEHEHDDLEGA